MVDRSQEGKFLKISVPLQGILQKAQRETPEELIETPTMLSRTWFEWVAGLIISDTQAV
jgi:hypothetical protein